MENPTFTLQLQPATASWEGLHWDQDVTQQFFSRIHSPNSPLLLSYQSLCSSHCKERTKEKQQQLVLCIENKPIVGSSSPFPPRHAAGFPKVPGNYTALEGSRADGTTRRDMAEIPLHVPFLLIWLSSTADFPHRNSLQLAATAAAHPVTFHRAPEQAVLSSLMVFLS